MLDQVTATGTGIKQALALQNQAGRFSTHAQLFSTFQDLVMDMQAKILDPAKTAAVQGRDVARLERSSDNGSNDFRDNLAARDTKRDPSDDRYSANDRKAGTDDQSVSQRDDAGRDFADDRRNDYAAAAGDTRDDDAVADAGQSGDRRQDAVNRDGDSDRGNNGQGSDGKSDQGEAASAAGSGNGENGQKQGQGQAQGAAAQNAQANVAAGQVDTLLATIAAQVAGSELGKQVSDIAKNIGEKVSEAAQQITQGLRDGNHGLQQAQNQGKNLRAMANLHTNGQAIGDDAKQAETLLQVQAGKIAEATGGGAKLMVNVNVKDDAAALSGRPLAALTAASAAQAGMDSANKGGQNGQSQAQTQVQNPVAQTAIAGTHQNPAQAQATQAQAQGGQAAQAQAAAQLSADGKGTVQVSSGANNAGTHSANSGDGNATQANANANQTQNTHQAQHAQKAQAQHQPQEATRNKVVDQVTVQINKAIKAGADRINIRLHPADLGRVEVRLEVAHDGRTIAMVTADKPETLEMLRRDSDQLAKALSDAGLDMEAGDLNYNLKGQEDGKEQKSVAGGNAGDEAVEDETLDPTVMDQAVAAHELGILHNGRVDVRA
ncbi:MAG: flagellar hook-length control protein FliK [Rhodospirillaceae bacterium]